MHSLWCTCLCPHPLLVWKTPVTTNDFVEVKISEKFNNLVKEGAADEMVIARLITRAATDITFHDTHHHSTLYYKTTIPHRTTPNYNITMPQHPSLYHTILMEKCQRDLGKEKSFTYNFILLGLSKKSCFCQTALVTRISNCPRFFRFHIICSL